VSIDVSAQDFNQVVIEGSRRTPVIVDFWAPWCAPCRALAPVLEKLETEYQGKFTLVKVNSDENQELAAQYGVRGIPNVKAFVGGELVDEFSGALPEQRVRGLRISGFTVMDGPEALGAVLASHMINLVVIADASLDCVGSVVATATEFGVDVRLLPSANNVLKDEVRVAAKLRPEMALLERGAVTHSPHPKLTAAYENRVVLVTGAGGFIGSSVVEALVARGARVTAFTTPHVVFFLA